VRSRRQAAAIVALTLTSVAVACSGGHPSPPIIVPATTTPPTYPDYSHNTLAAVAGQTTLTVALTPGTSNINGQVVDDTGAPVAGAIVHVERVVGSQVASTDIAAAADGTYSAQGIMGGLYRVRAWRIPDLALVNPQIFFLAAAQTYTANLQLQRFTGQQVSASIAPNPPIIDAPANIVVEAATDAVGTDGVVRGTGQPGVSVQLVGQGAWAISGSLTQITNGSGLVTWQATCTVLGPQALYVVLNNGSTFPLNLPACSVPPTTTTTLPATTSTTGGHTTTTRRGV
jgi:hypothetical protein